MNLNYVEFDENRNFIGRIPYGEDLYEYLTAFVQEKNIRTGQVSAIGAVTRAKVGFYDQHNHSYIEREFNKHLEIVSLTGNVSILDDKPFVHAHILVSDDEGSSYGGHLLKGTEVFLCEFIVKEFLPEKELVRNKDETTKLNIWEMEEA